LDGRSGYITAPKTPWHDDERNIIGYHRSYKNLHQLIVNKARQMAPYDQPASLFQMIDRFIQEEAIQLNLTTRKHDSFDRVLYKLINILSITYEPFRLVLLN
jgi:hypothetical protein